MRETLIEILKLSPGATDEEIITAAAASRARVVKAEGVDAREKAIREKVVESCGAMTRDVAIHALQVQKHPLFRS